MTKKKSAEIKQTDEMIDEMSFKVNFDKLQDYDNKNVSFGIKRKTNSMGFADIVSKELFSDKDSYNS